MSIQNWPGGVINKTPPTPSGPYENSTASGVWTLQQAADYVKQGNWPTAGNLPNYIEDVFQTWLYTGNGTSQTITNGVNLSGRGGMAWIKTRSVVESHVVVDTVRGASNALRTNSSAASINDASRVSAFTASGFTVGNNGETNDNNVTYASWTFRDQAKFFDVVTYTGDGVNGRQIPHNLGSVPGAIIFKATSISENWAVYHRSTGTSGLYLNGTNSAGVTTVSASHTSTVFVVTDGSDQNMNGVTYVAYLFAHNAGGFGLTGTDNVISCGSYTGNGSATGPVVTLGYEPQWFMVKRATGGTADWLIYDNMRGAGSNNTVKLQPNTSNAEDTMGEPIGFTATGFQPLGADSEINANGSTYIYVAIRRGPMKVPTTGTSVFSTSTSSATTANITSGFVTDLAFTFDRSVGSSPFNRGVVDRLRGNFLNLSTAITNAETSNTSTVSFQQNNGIQLNGGTVYANGYVYEQFQRAPGFFDEVCYTGTGSAMLINHNLGVPPELIITKRRNATSTLGWIVSSLYWFASTPWDRNGRLNQDSSLSGGGVYEPASSHSATQYPVSAAGSDVNASGGTYVAYLFASAPGVSKVGLYTGTGATQVINCGFTTGARFVLIKAASTTGNWLVWDSARGIVSGDDPYLALNSTAAEVTNTDWVDTAATGFELSNAGGNLANSNGVSYIFLAIA